jgi:2TM domain
MIGSGLAASRSTRAEGVARPIDDHIRRVSVDLEVMTMAIEVRGTDEELRDRAVQQLKKKAEFRAHLLAYVLVNAFLLSIWAVTGAGFFWPIFPIMGWAIGLAFNAWDVYRRQVPTEEQVVREMESLRRRQR